MVKPSVNQAECTPFLTQDKFLETCKELGVALGAYSSFRGSPKMTKEGKLDDHPVKKELFENELIQGRAKKYGKSINQILQVQRSKRNHSHCKDSDCLTNN